MAVTASQAAVGEALLAYAKELWATTPQPAVVVSFTPDDAANRFVLEVPNAFLAAVVFDYQMSAERAWAGPFWLSQRLGHFDMARLGAMDPAELASIMARPPALHRFNNNVARFLVTMARRVVREYDGDAANIWNDDPTASDLAARLMAFDGVGPKKADMAVNILMRDMGVKVRRSAGTNVAYDVHIDRVFTRTGLVRQGSIEAVQEIARELSPEDPGLLDLPTWYVGRNWCRPQFPNCLDCRLAGACPKLLTSSP